MLPHTFEATIQRAYTDTMSSFKKFSRIERYRKFVCPPALGGEPGFAIFYTPPEVKPTLVIIGQNPSNFAGNGAWTEEPNKTMLSGTIPARNSYLQDRHYFAKSLGNLFRGHEHLLENAVGLNVWHFQASSDDARCAPKELVRSCESTTRSLVAAMKPAAILCFSRHAFYALSKNRKGERVQGTNAEWLDIEDSRVWYVYHPTSSRTRLVSAHDAPIVLAEVESYLTNRRTPTS